MIFMAEKKSSPDNAQPVDAGNLMDRSFEDLVYARLGAFFEKLGSGGQDVHEILLPQFERPLIRLALESCVGNKCDAARLLGINRNTLLSKMKRYGMPTQPRFWRREPK